MDWEEWLRSAVRKPSDHEDSKRQRTEDQIRNALSKHEPLKGRPYRIYTKGSYANNTNVRLNYDVDIAVEYYGFFYYEFILDAAEFGPSDAGVVSPSSDTYTRGEFKRDIQDALEAAFGTSAVKAGNIAIRVRNNQTTLPADVVPCWELRRYDRVVLGKPKYSEGSRVYPSGGGHKDNFPSSQLKNGTAKNNRTGRRYKRMVRALKKLQTYMVQQGALDEELPSYFTEALVYNVPDDRFGHATYMADMQAVLAYIFNETRTVGNFAEWEHVHGLAYLFGAEFKRTAAHHVADVAWETMGFE